MTEIVIYFDKNLF